MNEKMKELKNEEMKAFSAPLSRILKFGSIKKQMVLAMAILFFALHFSVVFADSNEDIGILEKGHDWIRANLCEMNLCVFGFPRSISELGIIVMEFLGTTIIFASVGGFMIGGGFLVFSGGDESRVTRAKQILTASIIGLGIVLSSYLIIRLVQSVLYSI
jgi:hypothetical protein